MFNDNLKLINITIEMKSNKFQLIKIVFTKAQTE